jgi:hypothetical protein
MHRNGATAGWPFFTQRRQDAETWRNLDKDLRLFEGTSSFDALKTTFQSGEKTGDY